LKRCGDGDRRIGGEDLTPKDAESLGALSAWEAWAATGGILRSAADWRRDFTGTPLRRLSARSEKSHVPLTKWREAGGENLW